MFGFYDSRGEGAGQFPKDIPAQQNTAHTARVRGAIGKKSDMCFAVLIFDVEKVLAQAIATQKYHAQPRRSEKKNHALENCPFPPPQKKMVRLLHVVIMKGYSQFASEFGRPDGVEWIVQLIASEITNNITSLNAYT